MSLTTGLHARPCAAPQYAYQPNNKCFKSAHACVRLLASARRDVKTHAQGAFGTQIIKGGLGGGNEVFVAGADGQLGARVVQKLLQAGYKVAAGVGDQEQAQTVVDFASSVELLKKQEVQRLRLAELNLADTESIESVLPRGARVLVVASESSVKGAAKVDGRATSRILQAAQENDAQQFVLVTPAGTAGGGGFFSNLFGSPSVGGSGRKPSKVEQEIANSGLDFAVIRTGKTDAQSSGDDVVTNVALGGQGSLPPKSSISKAQVAEVIEQVLRQADADVLIEAWAGPEEPALSIEAAVAQALPAATIEEEEEEEEKVVESPVEAVQDAVQDVDVPEEVEKPARSLFGGIGSRTRKIKSTPSSDDESEEAPAPPAPKRRPSPPARRSSPAVAESNVSDNGSSTQRVGLFGFGKKKGGDEEDEKAGAPTKTQRQRGFLGVGKKAAQEVEEEVEQSATKVQRGFLGIGKKVKEEIEPEEEEKSNPLKAVFGSKKKEQADVSAESARSSARRGAKNVEKAAKKAIPPAARKGRAAAKEEEKPQKKGFLASIGLDSEKYVYEED